MMQRTNGPASRALRAAGLLVLGLAGGAAGAAPLGTSFTYQGLLTDGGVPGFGLYDLQACLYDAPTGPTQIDCSTGIDDVPVEDGLFTIALDFGAAPFSGEARYLELRVRPGDSTGAYTTLAPRQLLRATPEALRAGSAGSAPWSGLSGVPAGFADGVDDDSGGTVTAVTAGTGLDGGTITDSGTVAIADSGVGAAQLADNAVDTAAVQDLAISRAKIAPGAVGLDQVDASEVQARVSGACPLASYLREIAADGNVVCADLPEFPTAISTVLGPPAGLSFRDVALAIGPDGLPVLAYQNGGDDSLGFIKCGNPGCSSILNVTTVDDPVTGGASVAVPADGRPVFSYRDATSSGLEFARCADPACTGTAAIEVVDASPVGARTGLAIGSDGLPVIAYFADGDLWVAKCSDAGCSSASTSEVDASVVPGGDLSIALDAANIPAISYHDANAGSLKFARCVDVACASAATITTIDDPASGAAGLFNGVVFGANGVPMIAYMASGTSADVKIAVCGTTDCSGPVSIQAMDDVPDGSGVGAGLSLALGSDGLPVAAHYDVFTAEVRVVRCEDAGCASASVVVLDGPGSGTVLDEHLELVMGADGLPVVGLFNYGDNTVEVARCGSRSCR